MTIPGLSRRRVAAMLVFGVAATGVACSDDDSGDQSLLELRPVLTSVQPPCPSKAPEKDQVVLPLSSEGKVAECLVMGRPVVDASDARSATVGETTSKEPALSVVLGGVGGANLDGFAERNQGHRLAIVADGAVVSAPVVQYSSFAGRIQVTGLSKEKTDDLFRRLNKLIKKS
jgi:preprotein translocase subunit SecD